jgi:uncharacterized protein YyaL (SSP411 family)
MIERFYDSTSGGFFDAQQFGTGLGVLGTARKPFQDSPTPAGNPMAVIALLRIQGYTEDKQYREKAERTMGLLAGMAGQYGLFAATYAIAGVYLSAPHMQVVIVGEDEIASQLYREATASHQFGTSALKLTFSQAVKENLPPSLAATITNLPAIKAQQTCAVVCSGASCKPPVYEISQLREILRQEKSAA